MIIKNDHNKLIDYLFWIVFIVFTNPGGILEAFGEDRGDGGINVADFLFVFLVGCYILVLHNKNVQYHIDFKKIITYLVLFLIYYFIVFGFMVPELKGTASSTFKFVIIKSRQTIYSVFLFVIIYSFFSRSYAIFFKIFVATSILILSLFIFTLITGIEVLPIQKADRGFVKIDRIFLVSYGLMPLLIPLGAAVITFKININWKKYILIGFGLMFLAWLLSLTRRHIFGTVAYIIIALMLFNYFQHRVLVPLGKVLSTVFYTAIILFFIGISFPKYVDAGAKTLEETIYVMRYGQTTTGRQDQRLGFGRKFLVGLIKKNPLFGTGFDNRWRTAAGDDAGYETSDYPLMAALAMFGVFGVLIFSPIYIILIRILRKDYRILRKHNIDYQSFEFLIVITFILFFTYNLMQYMNWFFPLSKSTDHYWYVYLAMYLSSRDIFYNKHLLKTNTYKSKKLVI